jgi:hypothetical protein
MATTKGSYMYNNKMAAATKDTYNNKRWVQQPKVAKGIAACNKT